MSPAAGGRRVLSDRVLNRTLLQRQHLLERTTMPALAMTEHLVGLQGQEPLPPYLSLWSRIRDFDPATLSDALGDRTAVRLLLMRGTIHVVTPRDALLLRPVVQPALDRISRASAASRPAADVDRGALAEAVRESLSDGPLTHPRLAEALAARFPGVPPAALAATAREAVPLVQLPPRGTWRQPGGLVYQTLERWVGAEALPEPGSAGVAEVVGRYLRAFGPATAADITTWCGVTGMRAVLASMPDRLSSHRDADGRELFDLDGLPLADEDAPAPVRLLGRYDNLWLSHDRRDRVTPDLDKRRRWMGANAGVGATVFVDGVLEGLWRQTDAGGVDVQLFRRLGREERSGLDAEVAGVERLLAS